MTAKNYMTAKGRNSSSQGGIPMPYISRLPTNHYIEFNIEIKKGVPTLIGRVGAFFCLYIVTIHNGIYQCRSPPLLTF